MNAETVHVRVQLDKQCSITHADEFCMLGYPGRRTLTALDSHPWAWCRAMHHFFLHAVQRVTKHMTLVYFVACWAMMRAMLVLLVLSSMRWIDCLTNCIHLASSSPFFPCTSSFFFFQEIPTIRFKGEVRRKMNFTYMYVLGFVVLRDVVKVLRSVLLRFRERRLGGIKYEVTRGHDAAQRRNGISNCLFGVRHISSDTCLSKSEQQLPSSSSTLSSSDSSGAWIFSHFWIQVRSADECVAPGRRRLQEICWTSDGRLSSPETNLTVGLLPLFFMQRLLLHMFPSFMVRTSPLIPVEKSLKK